MNSLRAFIILLTLFYNIITLIFGLIANSLFTCLAYGCGLILNISLLIVLNVISNKRNKKKEIGFERLIHKIPAQVKTNSETKKVLLGEDWVDAEKREEIIIPEQTIETKRIVYDYDDKSFALKNLVIIVMIHYLLDMTILLICIGFNGYYWSHLEGKISIYWLAFLFGIIVFIVTLVGNIILFRNVYGLCSVDGFYLNDEEFTEDEFQSSPSKKCIPFWLVIFIGGYALPLMFNYFY